MHDRAEIAAQNNAAWCAAIWRAHGLPVCEGRGYIYCPAETPPFYPNVVTIDPAVSAQAQQREIADLASEARFEFGVKDSFGVLSMAGRSFELLFEATWLWRDFSEETRRTELRWEQLPLGDLASWEAAWAGDQEASRIFPDDLQRDPCARFVWGADANGRHLAGASGYANEGAVGITNAFGRELPPLQMFASGDANALVGYERGYELAQRRSLGFEPVGDLRVWVKPRVGELGLTPHSKLPSA